MGRGFGRGRGGIVSNPADIDARPDVQSPDFAAWMFAASGPFNVNDISALSQVNI